jgi:hypothetical protein
MGWLPTMMIRINDLLDSNENYNLTNVAIFQKFVDTPVSGRPSLFRIDTVHHMETSLSHALLVY